MILLLENNLILSLDPYDNPIGLKISLERNPNSFKINISVLLK